jgi:hypothetical protein
MAITPGGGSCLGPTTSSSCIARRQAESPVHPELRAWVEPRRWRLRVRPRLHNPVPLGRHQDTAQPFDVLGVRQIGGWYPRLPCLIRPQPLRERAFFQQKVYGWGGFEPYVRDHDVSCGRQIRHLHEVERDWPTLEEPSVHENPESPPRLLERAKFVGGLEEDPCVSHRSESRSSLDEPGLSRVAFHGRHGALVA